MKVWAATRAFRFLSAWLRWSGGGLRHQAERGRILGQSRTRRPLDQWITGGPMKLDLKLGGGDNLSLYSCVGDQMRPVRVQDLDEIARRE